ncbi:MAG: MmcQ/YjbR family DNA-binding protein [Maricaulaceae bacterium]
MTLALETGWQNIRDLVAELNLPRVEETTSYRKPCFKAHKKLWVWISPHCEAIVFKALLEQRDMLMAAEPHRYFVTDHYLGHSLVLVRPDQIDLDWARANLLRVWREQAPKRWLKTYNETGEI